MPVQIENLKDSFCLKREFVSKKGYNAVLYGNAHKDADILIENCNLF